MNNLLIKLDEYHKFIKKYYKKFVNKYDSKMTSFSKAKDTVSKGKNVGITCVVPLRWALHSMGIKNGSGKSLISAPEGTFKKYYTGDVPKHLTRITKGGPIGMTVTQAVDKGLLKPGDIVCYKGRTHTSVYAGKSGKDKYRFYEGGGSCTKNGHYPNGILMDYSKGFYKDKKISEVLRWKETPIVPGATATTTTTTTAKPATTSTTAKTTGKKYTGDIPEFSKKRSYYKKGDGYKTLTGSKKQIRRIQRALNWAVGADLKVDGEFGEKTEKAVKKFKKKVGLSSSGKWGKKCNAKLKAMRK